jgi:predicted RNase H-like nuclease (RuvC/YqgF family)
MSVEFSNVYQEILLENLQSIIKQNFVFQTQLKLVEGSVKEKEELKKKVSELTEICEKSKTDLSQLQSYKIKADNLSSLHEEKNRIQNALNEEMKKNTSLKREIDQKDSQIFKNKKEIDELKDYIKTLEEIVPVTKLKKLKSNSVVVQEIKTVTEIVKQETPKIENKIQKVLDGSTF